MPNFRGSRYVLLDGLEPLLYYIWDMFITPRAAGDVNVTAAEPGPKLRNVTDLDSRISIADGKGVVAANAGGTSGWSRTGIWYTPAETRSPGLTLAQDLRLTVGGTLMGGFTANENAGNAGYVNVGFNCGSSLLYARRTSDGTSPAIFTFTTSVDYRSYITLRAVGRFIAIKTGSGYPLLQWIDDWSTVAALYPGLTVYSKNDALNFDNFKGYLSRKYSYLATASDSCNRADGLPGSTDGAGHAEANSGSGLAWVADQGTWGISSNKLVCSVLDGGGKGIATVDTGKTDEIWTLKATRVGGLAGLVVRYEDEDNFIYAPHDGTNIALIQRLAGVETNIVAPVAATYAADAEWRVKFDGTNFWLYFNQAYIGKNTAASAPTGTKWGPYTTDVGNTFKDLYSFAVGNDGEYADLGTL